MNLIKNVIPYLKSFKDITFCEYPLPERVFYIFADTVSLKYAFFGSSKDRAGIEKYFSLSISKPVITAINFLDGYFSGIDKPLPAMDISSYTEKEQHVLKTLIKIPMGRTISYGDLAKKSGFGKAARFVGSTMAKNNFPIFIPCHRVIKSDGRIGNYSAGADIKRFLLEFERDIKK